jgi:hypothetical protein
MVKSRRMRWKLRLRRTKCIQNLVGKPDEKVPLGGDRRISKDNIKMDLKKIRYESLDWIKLTQGRVI